MPKGKVKSPRGPRQPKKSSATVYWVIGVVVLAVIALFAAKAFIKPPGSGLTAYDNALVSPPVMYKLSTFAPAVFSRVGAGSSNNLPVHVAAAPPLKAGGKPLVLYIGADYCPYCAAQRWPVILALSRFGAFNNLHYMTSSATDVYPNTATFSFYKSSYQSPYITFQSVELQGNTPSGGSYPALQKPTKAQIQILNKYDNTPYTNTPGAIPFMDIGGNYLLTGAGYDPGKLKGLDWNQIIAASKQPGSPVGQAILGSANALTAAVCAADGNQPASVCSDPSLAAIRASFPQQ